MSGCFYSKEDEDEVCRVLRALVGEWGSEKVTVRVPREWAKSGYGPRFGKIRIEFWAETGISISVNYDNGAIRYWMPCKSDCSH